MASIVLIDDHVIIMDALQYLIEVEGKHKIIGKFKTGNEFIDWIKKTLHQVDIAIIDIKLPDILGIEVANFLNYKFPEIKKILLSQFSNSEFVYAGLKVGVSAYVLKSSGGNELLKAIDSVLVNETYLSQDVAKLINEKKDKEEINFNLTEREREILELFVYGFSNKEISQKLYIESTTIDFHKKNLRQKLNVNKSIELVVKAIELGFVNIN
ncbi:MAG: response regulator transcription factor [Bacteroidota bacterium]